MLAVLLKVWGKRMSDAVGSSVASTPRRNAATGSNLALILIISHGITVSIAGGTWKSHFLLVNQNSSPLLILVRRGKLNDFCCISSPVFMLIAVGNITSFSFPETLNFKFAPAVTKKRLVSCLFSWLFFGSGFATYSGGLLCLVQGSNP